MNTFNQRFQYKIEWNEAFCLDIIFPTPTLSMMHLNSYSHNCLLKTKTNTWKGYQKYRYLDENQLWYFDISRQTRIFSKSSKWKYLKYLQNLHKNDVIRDSRLLDLFRLLLAFFLGSLYSIFKQSLFSRPMLTIRY